MSAVFCGKRKDERRFVFHERVPSECFQPRFSASLAIPTVDLSVAEVCDSLDHTGIFLGRGSAFRDCGIHLVGSYFSTDGLPWVTPLAGRFCGDLLPEGFRSAGAFQRWRQPL